METAIEPGSPETVEEGAIDDIPSSQELIEERILLREPKRVPIPKGLIVGPVEGSVAVEEQAGRSMKFRPARELQWTRSTDCKSISAKRPIRN